MKCPPRYRFVKLSVLSAELNFLHKADTVQKPPLKTRLGGRTYALIEAPAPFGGVQALTGSPSASQQTKWKEIAWVAS